MGGRTDGFALHTRCRSSCAGRRAYEQIVQTENFYSRTSWEGAGQDSKRVARSIAKNSVGGGRRTRTFEVIRRLIYSQLPLPLGTLPRPNSIGTHPLNGGGRAMDDVNTVSRWRAPGRARLWAKRHGKV